MILKCANPWPWKGFIFYCVLLTKHKCFQFEDFLKFLAKQLLAGSYTLFLGSNNMNCVLFVLFLESLSLSESFTDSLIALPLFIASYTGKGDLLVKSHFYLYILTCDIGNNGKVNFLICNSDNMLVLLFMRLSVPLVLRD
jgi:hypothetical protein